MANKTISPSMSFKGWRFWEWVKGNWTTIKEVVKVGLPLITLWLATGSYWQTAFGTIAGKFILDSIHYFVKE